MPAPAVGSRIGRPEKPAGLAILVAIVVAQLTGAVALLAAAAWLLS